MAKVETMFLRFAPSASPDVVTNKMYMEEAPTPVGYGSPSFDVGNNIVNGQVEVDLAALPGMTTTDGVYNVGVAAVDDRGNEASMSLLNDVPFDFVAPDQVGALTITNV